MTLFVSDYLHKYFHTMICHIVSTIFTDKSSELMYVNSIVRHRNLVEKSSEKRLHNLNCLTDGKYYDFIFRMIIREFFVNVSRNVKISITYRRHA